MNYAPVQTEGNNLADVYAVVQPVPNSQPTSYEYAYLQLQLFMYLIVFSSVIISDINS